MLRNLLSCIYLLVLAAGCFAYLLRHRRWDRALQLFGMLLPVTFITEILNFFLDIFQIDKNPVSHIFSIFELSITTIYFLFTNQERPRLWSIFWICLAATAIGAFDMVVQSIYSYNTIMLMVESFSISAMALYTLYHFSFDASILRLRTYPHFIVWTTLLISWTATFFFWAFLYSLKSHKDLYALLVNFQIAFFIMIYSIFAVVFYRADFSGSLSRQAA